MSFILIKSKTTDKWTLIADMTSPRGGVGLAPLSGNLVAVGGHNGKEYLKSVEIYLVNEKRWIQVFWLISFTLVLN